MIFDLFADAEDERTLYLLRRSNEEARLMEDDYKRFKELEELMSEMPRVKV